MGTKGQEIPHDKKRRKSTSLYHGYKLDSDAHVDEIKIDFTYDTFFDSYVKPRKPAKFLKGVNSFINIEDFNADNIEKYLDYKLFLQVEKKHENGFGSGVSREKMTFADLLNYFRQGSEKYYLTTQYGENEDSSDVDSLYSEDQSEEIDNDKDTEEESKNQNIHEKTGPSIEAPEFSDASSIGSVDLNDLHDDYEEDEEDNDPIVDKELGISESEVQSRLKDLLQPPLTNLYKSLSLRPSILQGLIPQQINLWMGYNRISSLEAEINLSKLGKTIPGSGTSSGLHHDHADNLYILLSGKKRFTLFAPSDAQKLYTVGKIHKVYGNGIIDYDTNNSSWRRIREDGAIDSEVKRWKLKTGVLRDAEKKKIEQEIEMEENKDVSSKASDPPSFSKIPPALLHIEEFEDPEMRKKLTTYAYEKFPGLLQLNKLTVWLLPGEMLYLPSGWFHEVTSFGQSDAHGLENLHTALNFWFAPPDGSNSRKPYLDLYWDNDWVRTQACIKALESDQLKNTVSSNKL